MSRGSKIGVVVAGYAAASMAALVAGRLYDVRVSALPYDTSGGMYAGGQMITSLAVFLVVALAPTLLALWFVRRQERFWNAVGAASIAFAGTGLLAVLTPLAFRDSSTHPALLCVDLFGLSQLLGVPLWFVAFALFAWLAPTRQARRRLLIAVALELVIGICALVHWFVPRPPL